MVVRITYHCDNQILEWEWASDSPLMPYPYFTFYGIKFDLVVTLCENAKKVCPVFPGAKKMIHKSYRDPSVAKNTEEEQLKIFREVRDEIMEWVKNDLIKTY